jgi:hypothetical protein
VHRRTTPRVKRGKVQKKHRWELTPDYAHGRFDGLRFDRRAPGRGYRHLLGRRDVERFLALLPDWDGLSTGLQAVLLTPGESNLDGYHYPGVVAVCAWPQELWQVVYQEHVDEHEDLFRELDVARESLPDGRVRLLWTRPQARAYQLLHVLLHELGHHHDRMTTRSRTTCARGEPYAEAYAQRYAGELWENYARAFAE